MGEKSQLSVYWEVVDDIDVQKFAIESDARKYFNEMVAYARDPQNRFRGRVILRQIVNIAGYGA